MLSLIVSVSIPHRIGRHSKSLDTTKFVCALCTGQLVLLTPSKPRAPTAFATFVKENYSSARQELTGQRHAEVMRKLSADFACKTRLSKSWYQIRHAWVTNTSTIATAALVSVHYQITGNEVDFVGMSALSVFVVVMLWYGFIYG